MLSLGACASSENETKAKAFYEEIAQKCYGRALKYDISNLVKEYNQIYQNLLK